METSGSDNSYIRTTVSQAWWKAQKIEHINERGAEYIVYVFPLPIATPTETSYAWPKPEAIVQFKENCAKHERYQYVLLHFRTQGSQNVSVIERV